MADEVVFYHWPMSRGRMVHFMLEEVGAPYRIELTSLEQGDHKKPGFLAINPMGKLPAIVHRGVTITETAAIITYLADEFPAARLAPAIGEPARGTYLRWMFYGAGCVDAALIDRMLERPAPERVGAVGYGRLEHVVETLEKAISPGPYLLGERFTAADLYIGSQIGFGMMMKALEPRPAFQAYFNRVASRPASKRAIEQGEALIAKAKALAAG
jgi:glutathione S-transferase